MSKPTTALAKHTLKVNQLCEALSLSEAKEFIPERSDVRAYLGTLRKSRLNGWDKHDLNEQLCKAIGRHDKRIEAAKPQFRLILGDALVSRPSRANLRGVV